MLVDVVYKSLLPGQKQESVTAIWHCFATNLLNKVSVSLTKLDNRCTNPKTDITKMKNCFRFEKFYGHLYACELETSFFQIIYMEFS